MAKYVWKRRGISVLWFQRRVPDDIRPVIGKSVIQEPLSTRSPSDAAALARIRAAQLDREWASIRARKAIQPGRVDAGAILRWSRATALNDDLARRQTGELEPVQPYQLPEKFISALSEQAQLLRQAQDEIDPSLEPSTADINDMMVRAAETVLTAYFAGLPNEEQLLERYEQASGNSVPDSDRHEIKLLVRDLIDRIVPVVSERSHDPVALAMAEPEPRPKIGIRLETFRDRFFAQVKIAPHTWTRVKRAFVLLGRLVGNPDIRTINKDQARELRDILLAYPIGKSEGRVADKMKLRDIPNQKWGRTITGITVKQYIGVLSRAWKWGISEGLADENPFVGLQIKEDGAETARRVERRDYSDQELLRLFKSPLFTGCKSETRLSEAGKLKVRDHRFWIPWLALYTGARLSELCQLEKSNLKRDGRVWYLEITTIDEDKARKRLKTKQSKRDVPLHWHLVELGFIEYCRKVESGRLFPAYDDADHLAHEFTKRFAYYMDRVGMSDPALTFHSFRHTFKTASRFANVPDIIHDALTGHAPQNVGQEYGQNKRRIPHLKSEIDKVRYAITPRRKASIGKKRGRSR